MFLQSVVIEKNLLLFPKTFYYCFYISFLHISIPSFEAFLPQGRLMDVSIYLFLLTTWMKKQYLFK